MDTLEARPLVPLAALGALQAQASEAGIDVTHLTAGLPLDCHEELSSQRLDLITYLRLQARLTAALQDETCRLSKRQLLSGSTELALSRLPSRGHLLDAMTAVARSYNLLHGGEFNQIEEREDGIAFVCDDTAFPFAVEEEEQRLFIMETTLLFVHALLRLIVPTAAAGGWAGIELRRASPPARVPFESFVPVRYGCRHYAVVYSGPLTRRVVNFPPPGTISLDAVTEEEIRLLQGRHDERTLSGRVRMLIEEGAVDQTAVAQTLGMSVATLRRRLVEEGGSFRSLRMQVLQRQAEALLRTTMPIAHIAERLGFSDVRSFSRAFKGWTGKTPNEMRRTAHL
ncbi:MAG: helix-turn-helix domain-containing protein [Parvularcula sp.]|nr:helix-turn-helix domain-containing protein [Parvularcula sp.]